jgi:hypothetical protein
LDPQIGRTFEQGEFQGAKIVVAIGDCLSCSMHSADFSVLRVFGEDKVVAIHMKGADLSEVSKDYEWLKFAPDESGLHQRLNAFWTPRAYALDGEGKLLALQIPDEPLKSFVDRVRKAK